MRAFRRKTRETHRHERAAVLQELGAQAAGHPAADFAANRKRAAELRKWAAEHGHTPKPLIENNREN